MISTKELKILVAQEKQEQDKAIQNFIEAFNALKELRINVAYYNFYSGYTRLPDVKEFCFEYYKNPIDF